MANTAIWRVSNRHAHQTVIGENKDIRIEIVPSRGSKMVSFINKQTGKEWVYSNDRPWEPLVYGMNWGNADRTGWDEMFPSILPCMCPDHPWEHAAFPDHGEVWTLPWQYELGGESARMWVHGVQVPYILEKTYRLEGQTLIADYKVENPTPFPFSYLWAAHALLEVEPGTKLVTEPELNSVIYYYSHNDRIGRFNDRVPYPIVKKDGITVDLSELEPKFDRVAEKYWYEGEMRRGIAGVKSPDGETLTYLFSPQEIPYLAVWANYGAFWGEYNFAFEPATGFLDNVSLAKSLQKIKTVAPYSSNRWRLSISLDPAVQQLAVEIR